MGDIPIPRRKKEILRFAIDGRTWKSDSRDARAGKRIPHDKGPFVAASATVKTSHDFVELAYFVGSSRALIMVSLERNDMIVVCASDLGTCLNVF